MLKVVDLYSEEELMKKRKREKENKKLTEIAKEMFRFRVDREKSHLFIRTFPFWPDYPIRVHLRSDLNFPFNRIEVENPKYFNKAVELAEAYERAGFGEFTVKKDYRED